MLWPGITLTEDQDLAAVSGARKAFPATASTILSGGCLVGMNGSEIVTITFFRYIGLRDAWFGFRQMGIAPGALEGVDGLQFCKMLGSGSGNGFSIWPDFTTYGLLAVWDSEEQARTFFRSHPVPLAFVDRSREYLTLYMRTAKVHGEWNAGNPFPVTTPYASDQLVGVLTRATIHTKHLWRFWRFVPAVSGAMSAHREGLLFSKGVGELPLIQQATFSLWENSQAMQAYAYQSTHHREVIQKTRELGWYKEELFARFHPYASAGHLSGVDLPSSITRYASAKKNPA